MLIRHNNNVHNNTPQQSASSSTTKGQNVPKKRPEDLPNYASLKYLRSLPPEELFKNEVIQTIFHGIVSGEYVLVMRDDLERIRASNRIVVNGLRVHGIKRPGEAPPCEGAF